MERDENIRPFFSYAHKGVRVEFGKQESGVLDISDASLSDKGPTIPLVDTPFTFFGKGLLRRQLMSRGPKKFAPLRHFVLQDNTKALGIGRKP